MPKRIIPSNVQSFSGASKAKPHNLYKYAHRTKWWAVTVFIGQLLQLCLARLLAIRLWAAQKFHCARPHIAKIPSTITFSKRSAFGCLLKTFTRTLLLPISHYTQPRKPPCVFLDSIVLPQQESAYPRSVHLDGLHAWSKGLRLPCGRNLQHCATLWLAMRLVPPERIVPYAVQQFTR